MTETTAICHLCGAAQRIPPLTGKRIAVCFRCETTIAGERPDSLNRTLAFSTAALLMYIPANVLPIMTFEYYGARESSTVLGGARNLADGGMWFVAAVVFLASIVVPLLKLSGLFYLTLSIRSRRVPGFRSRIYRMLRVVGPWAMLDVFLLSVLVSAVKLGQLATVAPGPAALPFAFVVVFTTLATESFDPHLLWNHERSADR